MAGGKRLEQAPRHSGVARAATRPAAVRSVVAGRAPARGKRGAFGVARRASDERMHSVVEGRVLVLVGDLLPVRQVVAGVTRAQVRLLMLVLRVAAHGVARRACGIGDVLRWEHGSDRCGNGASDEENNGSEQR